MRHLAVTILATLVACAPTSIPEPSAASASPSVTQGPAGTVATTTASPSPIASPTERVHGFRIVESDAWLRLPMSMPADVPMPRTTWLPDGIDPVVEMNATMTPVGYEITYFHGDDIAMRFSVGTAVAVGTRLGSGLGTRVRGALASLDFDTTLFQRPGGRGQRRLSWREGAYGLAIESEVLTGDTMLHVGWSLDPSGSPADPKLRSPTRDGACASKAAADATVRAYVAAIGRHDQSLLADCWAMGTESGSWADLPTTSALEVRDGGAIGGREWMLATWTFARDPGGAFNQRQSMFFIVGRELDRYRIFEAGTAPYGPPP